MAIWAKGIDFKNASNTVTLGGIGLYGTDNTTEKIYLGFDSEPWNNSGLQITKTDLNFKGNKVYHAGDKPTASEIGAANSSHTHDVYLNQNAFSNIKIGTSIMSAHNSTDTFEIIAGNNITLTSDSENDRFTVSAIDTTYNLSTINSDGLMSHADKSKLDGIEEGANNYIHPDTSSIRHVTDSEKSSWNTAASRASTWSSFKTSGGSIGGTLSLTKANIDNVLFNKDTSLTTKFNINTTSYKTLEFGVGSNCSLQLDSNTASVRCSPYNVKQVSLGSETCAWKDVWVGDISRNSVGYTTLTNGLILQWGYLNAPIYGTYENSFQFPIPFPNNTVLHISCSCSSWNKTSNILSSIAYTYADNFHVTAREIEMGGDQFQLYWIALGY